MKGARCTRHSNLGPCIVQASITIIVARRAQTVALLYASGACKECSRACRAGQAGRTAVLVAVGVIGAGDAEFYARKKRRKASWGANGCSPCQTRRSFLRRRQSCGCNCAEWAAEITAADQGGYAEVNKVKVILMQKAEQTEHVTKTMKWQQHSHGINVTTTTGIDLEKCCRRNGVIELCSWHHKRHFCLRRDV